MVTAKISDICRSLVYIGLRGDEFSFNFQDDNRSFGKKNGVRPPRFHRQRVFEYGGIIRGGIIHLENLPDFVLKRRDGTFPSANLFWPGVL
jgi:hypothetical protein